MFLTFLTRCFVLAQWNCVVSPPFILPFYMLPYIFLLILYFIRRYTNFQKRFIYSYLLRKFLEILQFFQYTKIYEAMENVGIALFYRICVVATIKTMKLLIQEILSEDENLISIFHFLCKAIVPIYCSVFLPLLLSKKFLSCSICFIKFLILCTRRLLMLMFMLMLTIFNQNLGVIAKILSRRYCFPVFNLMFYYIFLKRNR